ncbi:MAG: hypothetical protein ACLTD2_01645 [Ruminococcus sp.]
MALESPAEIPQARVYGEGLKALSGSAAREERTEHSAELTEYGQIRTKVLELYPSGHIPTVESLDKKINALIQERSLKDQQFREADKRARDLADAQRTIEEFLRQERNEQPAKTASVKRMGIWVIALSEDQLSHRSSGLHSLVAEFNYRAIPGT